LLSAPNHRLRTDTPTQSPRALERAICLSVVSHRQGKLLDHLLADLADHTARGSVRQVIVTVNDATDGWQPPSPYPGLDVIPRHRPLGFGANHNRAFLRCRQPYFAVVNPDIRIDGDPFTPLLRALEADPLCELAVPVQANALGERETFARPLPTPWNVVMRRLIAARRIGVSPVRAPQWVAGAFMLWRSARYQALGGFDERYFLYCEDVDICLRLQLEGLRFAVVEEARVIHDARRDSRRSLRLLARHAASLTKLWCSPVFWRYLRAGSPPCPA